MNEYYLMFTVLRRNPFQLFLENLDNGIDHYSSKYEHFMLLGEFNAEETDENTNECIDIYSIASLVKGVNPVSSLIN